MDIEQSSGSGADYEGGSNKKMKFSPPEKLCVILKLVHDYGVFIVDLNNAPLVDGLWGLRLPHLRFRHASTSGFCVVGNTLYKFPSSFHDDDRVVYSYNLSQISELEMELNNMDLATKAPDMLGSKVHPTTICFKSKILIFSTKVFYGNRTKRIDFELYDPEGKMSKELPKLCLRRPKIGSAGNHSSGLWRSDLIGYEEFKFCVGYPENEWDGRMFDILSFSIMKGHTLIVLTSMGQQFSLDLESSEGWRLYEGGMLRCSNQTFVVTENELHLDADGAYYNIKSKEVRSEENFWDPRKVGRQIDFPVTWFGDCIERDRSKSSITLLEYDDPECAFVCSVQMGFDTSPHLFWSVDLLRFDISKFPPKDEHDEDEQGGSTGLSEELVQRINSFKFFFDETFEFFLLSHISVTGLFPF